MLVNSETSNQNIDRVILSELRKPKGVLFSEIVEVNESNFQLFLDVFRFQVKTEVNSARKKQFMEQVAKTRFEDSKSTNNIVSGTEIFDALEYINKNRSKFPFKVLIVGYSVAPKNSFDSRNRGEYLSSVATTESLLLSSGYRNDIRTQIIGSIIDKKQFENIVQLQFPENPSIEFSIYILEKTK